MMSDAHLARMLSSRRTAGWSRSARPTARSPSTGPVPTPSPREDWQRALMADNGRQAASIAAADAASLAAPIDDQLSLLRRHLPRHAPQAEPSSPIQPSPILRRPTILHRCIAHRHRRRDGQETLARRARQPCSPNATSPVAAAASVSFADGSAKHRRQAVTFAIRRTLSPLARPSCFFARGARHAALSAEEARESRHLRSGGHRDASAATMPAPSPTPISSGGSARPAGPAP